MSRALHTIVAATVLAACADSALEPGAAPNAVGTPVALEAASSRPAGGTCTFQSTVLPPEPGQPANVRRVHLDYICQLKHLGRTTGTGEETVTFTPTGQSLVQSITYTGANGDQLFVNFDGTATPPDQNGVLSFSGIETVTGGTGRFAGASGSLSHTGTASLVTHAGQSEISGTLTY
jgi:hypothetical protein